MKIYRVHFIFAADERDRGMHSWDWQPSLNFAVNGTHSMLQSHWNQVIPNEIVPNLALGAGSMNMRVSGDFGGFTETVFPQTGNFTSDSSTTDVARLRRNIGPLIGSKNSGVGTSSDFYPERELSHVSLHSGDSKAFPLHGQKMYHSDGGLLGTEPKRTYRYLAADSVELSSLQTSESVFFSGGLYLDYSKPTCGGTGSSSPCFHKRALVNHARTWKEVMLLNISRSVSSRRRVYRHLLAARFSKVGKKYVTRMLSKRNGGIATARNFFVVEAFRNFETHSILGPRFNFS